MDLLMPSPWASQYMQGGTNAANTVGHAARTAEARKVAAYRSHHNCVGFTFRPVGIEALGRWGEGAMKFAREGIEGAGFTGKDKQRAYDTLYKAVAFDRVRWNSRILTAGVGLSTAHAGRNHLPGCPVPNAHWVPGSGMAAGG